MKCKILVVEDDLLIARDIKEVLTEEGYMVRTGDTSVEQAIAGIESYDPQLVLIDVNLHGSKDGTELGRYLTQKDTVPFVYITSYTDKITLDRIKCTRPHGFIVKPFEPVNLTTTVEIVLHNYSHRKVDPLRNEEVMKNDAPYLIKKSIQYIDEHIDQKIDVAALASLTRWKTHHFIRTFMLYTGQTPYQYILFKKIERAKAMLEETCIPITQISFDIGFQSYKNFYLAFKRLTNVTPESYRRIKYAVKLMEDDAFI